jgi:hypothetical protein
VSMLHQKTARHLLAALALGVFALIMAACGTTAASSQVSGATPTPANGSVASQTHKTLTAVSVLKWNGDTKDLEVTVTMSGLAPNSRHPNHIHSGDCAANGPVLYPLTDLVANGDGNATSKTIIHHVQNGIPASGWYVNVHEGPGLSTPAQATAIACGNVSNPNHSHELVVKLSSFFLNQFSQVDPFGSTVPGNGDVNPYGIAVIQHTVGRLQKGHILVSNFNNAANLQGTGSTIVDISSTSEGQPGLFAQIPASACPGGIGLTTALVELSRGWVIVGSLPTADGTSATTKAGCLIVLDSQGKVVETFANSFINGPWDATVVDKGSEAVLFVANVLNGTVAANGNIVNGGTIVRFTLKVPNQGDGKPSITSSTVIGKDFGEQASPAALVIGPTGLGLGEDGTLYINDSLASRILAIPDALDRHDAVSAATHVITVGGSLNVQLGLAIAPNGDILTVNGNDGNIVETTPQGVQVVTRLISNEGNPPGAGCLFNLAVVPGDQGVYFVNDCTNQLDLLH